MTLEQFIAKYNGKFVEAGGSEGAKFQCVDLINQYIFEALQQEKILWANAVDFPTRADLNIYDFITNSPDGFPVEGDLVIFKKYGSLYGLPGHIAIVISADVKTMSVFEQNYLTGSASKVGTHNYLGCVGWLHPKETINTSILDIRLRVLDEEKIITEGDVRAVISASNELPVARIDIQNANKEIERLKHQVEQDKTDLKMESDANMALKQAYENHLETIGKNLGNGSDLPGILQQISILTSKADLADKQEKQLKAIQNNNANLKADIIRKDETIKTHIAKIDSLTDYAGQLSDIFMKWLNLSVVTPEAVLGALQGLTVKKELLITKIINYFKKWRKK